MYKPAIVTFSIFSSMVLLLSPVSAQAQATINVPRDQPTIQAGINAASDGDTILVAPGKYVENIDFMGKAISVTSSGGAANTIIDGGAIGPTVTFASAETRASVLSGMTIQNGGGYGVNATAPGAAGVVVFNSSPTIQNNTIAQNQCWDVEVLYAAPLIQGNEVSSTQSPARGCGAGTGAGIYVEGNLTHLDLDLTDPGSPAVIVGNTIENITQPAAIDTSQTFTNLYSEDGGAAIAVFAGSPLIANNIIQNNSTLGGNGGAINIVAGNPLVENNTIRNNSASAGNGGAINIAGANGATLAQNLIYGNSAGCGGGALSFSDLYTGDGTYLLVANNTIVDNASGSAGAYTSCGDVSQIYSDNFGLSSPNVIFVNNIVSSNSAAPAVGCYSLPTTPSESEQSIFDHNLLYNGGGSFFGPTCIDVSAKYGNISAAPQFVDGAAGDYQLVEGSPGIDNGNNSALSNISELSGAMLATDFNGNPRVQDATGVSYPIIDMGAYEVRGAVDGSPTSIVLTSTTYAGTPGEPLTLVAFIQAPQSVPTGSIAFFLDGRQIGTDTISSQGYATLNSVVPSAGTHSFYAIYTGAAKFIPARSVIIIVTGTGASASKTYTTSLTIAPNIETQQYGQDVTFTIQGTSTDPNPSFSPSPVTLTVNQAVFSSVTLNREGTALLTTNTLPIGEDTITASYAGDATHSASTASTRVYVNAPLIHIQMSCNPQTIYVGQTSALTVNLSETSETTVLFRDDGAILGEVPVVNGTASLTYLGRTMGLHDIEAFSPAFAPLSVAGYSTCPGNPFSMPPIPPDIIVLGLPSTSVLSVRPATGSYLTATTMTATVSPAGPPGYGTPSGPVAFFSGTTLLGSANLVAGVATFNTLSLPGGMDAVTCAYPGDTVYLPSNCNTVPVTRSSIQPLLTLAASSNPIPALTPVTFTVALSAGGQPVTSLPVVLVSAGGQTYPLTLDANGMAGVDVSNLQPGNDTVTAGFAGNANLLSASASLTETVGDTASTTALSVSPSPGYVGQAVTLAAMVTVQYTLVPTGATITFYDGTTVLGTGTVDLSRTATFTTTSLTVGTHSLTASYPGTGVFTNSTSPPVSETILASNFTITLSPSTVTLPPDHSANVAIQLASIGGFAGPLTLSYGTLPVNASANILPLTVTLTAGGGGTSTLVLNTALLTPTMASRSRGAPAWPAVLAATLVLLVPRRRRGFIAGARLLLCLAFIAALLQTVTACGDKFYTLSGVAPGTYQIPVSATDINQNKQTAVLTLVVPSQ